MHGVAPLFAHWVLDWRRNAHRGFYVLRRPPSSGRAVVSTTQTPSQPRSPRITPRRRNYASQAEIKTRIRYEGQVAGYLGDDPSLVPPQPTVRISRDEIVKNSSPLPDYPYGRGPARRHSLSPGGVTLASPRKTSTASSASSTGSPRRSSLSPSYEPSPQEASRWSPGDPSRGLFGGPPAPKGMFGGTP